MEYKLENLEENCDLELSRIIDEIGGKKAKGVLPQLSDGLNFWILCQVIIFL
jgi:hypothetical protein